MRRFGISSAVLIVALTLVVPSRWAVAAAPSSTQITVPNGVITSFSPDGNWLLASLPIPVSAGFTSSLRALQANSTDADSPKLCVYAFPSLTLRSCTAPGTFDADSGPRHIDGIVSWSSDDSAITFANGSLAALVDGDIWTMDTTTGALKNLTDDGLDGAIDPSADDKKADFDASPAFTRDGSIVFARTNVATGKTRTTIEHLLTSTGMVTPIVQLPAGQGFTTVTGPIIFSEDGNHFWLTTAGTGGKDVSFWSGAIDSDQLTPVAKPADRDTTDMQLVAVSPDESQAIVLLPRALNIFKLPYYALVDLQTGKVTPVSPPDEDAVAYGIAFATDGSLLIVDRLASEDDGARTSTLTRRDLAGGPDKQLAKDLPPFELAYDLTGLTVVTDDLVAYQGPGDDESSPVVIVSHSGAPIVDSSPVAGGIGPGSSVVTTAPTALRSTPTITAAIAESLDTGADLTVIDTSVTIDGVVWWPVRDAATGALGYVQAAAIAPK